MVIQVLAQGLFWTESSGGVRSGPSFDRWGRNALARVIGSAWPVRKVSPQRVRETLAQGQPRKILFVRAHQGLGDLLLATPVFRALRESDPSLQLHFLASAYNAVAVRENPRLDRVWEWDKKKWIRTLSLFRRLRRERFDVAVVISSHTPSFMSFLWARLSGAKVVWAYATEGHYGGANWSRWMAHVEIPESSADMPEYVKFMNLVKPLCDDPSNPIQPSRPVDYTPEFYIGPEEREWARQRIQGYHFPAGRPLIGLFLGGNPDRPERLWPSSAWAELGRKLLGLGNSFLIAIVPPPGSMSGSGAREPGIYTEVTRLLGTPMPVFSDPDLRKVAAFLSQLSLFICSDGGLMHIAIASHVPTLGLFFGADPKCWLPPVGWIASLGAPGQKSADLLPDDVFQKVQQMLFNKAAAEPYVGSF